MSEIVNKLQPDRTLYMRGFDRRGACACLCQASPTGFSAYTVFKDMADFQVIIPFDADNQFEHHSIKPLPDFALTGMVLTYSYSSYGTQPIDSAKFSWIDWASLDYITSAGEPGKIRLWQYAALSGSTPSPFSVASASVTVNSTGCTAYDRITLWVNNLAFDFIASGGESAATVASNLAYQVNTYNWNAYALTSTGIIVEVSGNVMTFRHARYGSAAVSGTSVSWASGEFFTGIAPGSLIYLGGFSYTVASVNSPISITLTATAPTVSNTWYQAERGGADGNMVTLYFGVRTYNVNLGVSATVIPLSGGNSDNVEWDVSLDFTALGIDQLRQAWFTLSPALTAGAAYASTEGGATWSSWAVTDPSSIRALKVAGQNSVLVSNRDTRVTYAGTGWAEGAANNYHAGFAHVSQTSGDSVTVQYTCQETHDLWLGTELYSDRGIVNVSLDGGTATPLDLFVYAEPGIMSRRKVGTGVAAGSHSVVITLTHTNHAAIAGWDYNSTGYYFLFDYLEAVVASDFPDALTANAGVTAALDYDTDATYKMTPQRLLWALTKLGLMGRINEYLGVFNWNQRVRSGGAFVSATVTFAGTWANSDSAFVAIGSFTFGKTYFQYEDTLDTIAQHFVYYINQTSVEAWAEHTGTGQLTIHMRSPEWNEPTFAASVVSAAGTVATSGSLGAGTEGAWMIDDTASNPVSWPARQWHSDFYGGAHAAGLDVVTAISMELVNPPDNPGAGKVYAARFANDTAITTDTDFDGLFSTQCALGSSTVIAFQESVLNSLATLQSAAGLPVWIQFGEFLWWYFSSASLSIGYASYTSPISIGTVDALGAPLAHGFSTGDRVVQAGIGGNTAANGTFTITVTDPTHYTLNGTGGNGTYTSGGTVSGGSMGYYDQDTTTAATAALSRALYVFTCQDDDPSANSGADAAFLAARLKAHIDSLRTYLLGLFTGASFELLWPDDVNFTPCYYTPVLPFPQGGRINRAVNYPTAWTSPSTSGINVLMVEALSWGSEYRNIDNVSAALAFPSSGGLSWPNSAVGYLVPIFNGGCPWTREYLKAVAAQVSLIVLWAWDHIGLMSWPLPLPVPTAKTTIS